MIYNIVYLPHCTNNGHIIEFPESFIASSPFVAWISWRPFFKSHHTWWRCQPGLVAHPTGLSGVATQQSVDFDEHMLPLIDIDYRKYIRYICIVCTCDMDMDCCKLYVMRLHRFENYRVICHKRHMQCNINEWHWPKKKVQYVEKCQFGATWSNTQTYIHIYI